MAHYLDILIPVYNEGKNIVSTLDSIVQKVKTPFQILICFDQDDDDTLSALASYSSLVKIQYVKNLGKGALGAVITGFQASSAPAVLVFPADDDYNSGQIDAMVAKHKEGNKIVCASRFIPGGSMVGCHLLKATLVRISAYLLCYVARVPSHDASNGFRLFSQDVLKNIPIESKVGFAYSMELLTKCHRLGWPIAEVPVHWFERIHGKSRFQVLGWLPQYLVWFRYAFATTFLFKGPKTVKLRNTPPSLSQRPAA